MSTLKILHCKSNTACLYEQITLFKYRTFISGKSASELRE
nr:MAG TPA: hypothetical protein [Caudoviricetes sp.]